MRLLLLLLIFKTLLGRSACQTAPAQYPTHPYDQFASHFRQPYSTIVVTGDQGPDYFKSLYAYPQLPQLLTPCSHMLPMTIIIGNTNSPSGFSIEFGCNYENLADTIVVNSTYSHLKINSTAILEGACAYFASYLNMASFSVFQTNSYTNFTYLIPGNIVSHTLSLIPTSSAILGTLPKLDWVNAHFFGRKRKYDLPTFLNLAGDFTGTFSLPLTYKIFLPDDVLPGVTVVGSNTGRYYQDQFNVTLTHGNLTNADILSSSLDSNDQSSSKWNPKKGLAGVLPVVYPTVAIMPIQIYQDWRKDENRVVPWWGASNVPIGFSPLRVIPPSNLPKSGYKGCRSNFEFYYPELVETDISQKSLDKNQTLGLLKNTSESNSYYLNTLQGTFFFNKVPYSMNKDTNGQLTGVLPGYRFLDTNYIGGCFFNGTYPLAVSESGAGFKSGSLCFTDSMDPYPTSNSQFYPPPLKHSGFLTQPGHMVGVFTSMSQFVRYSVSGGVSQNQPENLRPFSHKYPGLGISQSIIYDTYHHGPRIMVKSPFNVYEKSSIEIPFDYFALGEPYTLRMFGRFGSPGSAMSCRSPRYIPNTDEMRDIKVEWLCLKPKNAITQLQAATEIKRMVSEDCTISKDLEPCVTSQGALGVHSWSLSIPSESYDKKKIALIVQNLTDTNFPKTFSSYKNAGSWFRITVLEDNPYEETWYPHSFCNVLPVLPVVPVSSPQILRLNSMTQPWDHFRDSIYSVYVSTQETTYVSVELSMGSETSLSASTAIFTTAYLLCQNMQPIQVKVFPEKLSLSSLLTHATVPLTAEVPPVAAGLRGSLDCFLNFYTSFSQPFSGRVGTFSSFSGAAPASPPSGIAMYSYFLLAESPPFVGSLSLYAPDTEGAVLTDAIFLLVEKILYGSDAQSGVFPSVGLVASSTPIIGKNSTVILLGDSLLTLPQTIRLPAIKDTWYVFFRAQTSSNSGCSIPCMPNIQNTFYSHWCAPSDSEIQMCPKQIVKMQKKDSDQNILDAIAASLNSVSYYSLNDALQLLSALFLQPVSQRLVWEDFFELLYEKILDPIQIPRALDFAASRHQLLFVLRQVLETAYKNPRLKIDTLAPLQIFPNVTLNAECANNPGTKYLILDNLDLLLANNRDIGTTLDPSSRRMDIILRGVEAVANRFSFWSGPSQTLNYTGKYSGINVAMLTTSFFMAYSGTQVGKLKFKYLTKMDFRELHLIDSYYLKLNERLYSPQEVQTNCSSSLFTISSTSISSERIFDSLVDIGKRNKTEIKDPGVYIGSASLLWCSVDYQAINMLQQMEFRVSITTGEEMDLSNMLCAARIKDKWQTSACRTTLTVSKPKGKETSNFECSCNAISDYALVGFPVLRNLDLSDGSYDPFSPSINKPWGGFDDSLESFTNNETLVSQIVNSSFSGFISTFETLNGAPFLKSNLSTLGAGPAIRGSYNQEGREEKRTFGIEWGINETQSVYNISNNILTSSNNNNYILWGPTRNYTQKADGANA
ncbi:putative secreted protein [Cryptosporidium canis]|nr:putative secreted protein [Cryptosporidium canis]